MESDCNHDEGSNTQIHNSISEVQSTKIKRIKLYSKSFHDPLAGALPRTVPIIALLSLNRLKAVGLRNILEEKQLSMDNVVEQYPDIWCTIKYDMFKKFTKS